MLDHKNMDPIPFESSSTTSAKHHDQWHGKSSARRRKGWPRDPRSKPSWFSPSPIRPEGWNDQLEAEFQASEPVLSTRQLQPPKGKGKFKYWSKVVTIIVVIALLIVAWYYHKRAVDKLATAKEWVQARKAWTWVIPSVALVIMCIPPMFGHEAVSLLCGLFWGPWIGLAIVGGSTFVGEMIVFFAFRFGCRSRAEKHRHSNALWAGTEYLFTRSGGPFWWLGGQAGILSFWTRLSLIPGHFTTVLLALVNMNWFVYMWVTLVTQVKQLAPLYAGVLYGQAGGNKTDKMVTAAVWIVSIIISLICVIYFYIKLNQNEAIVWNAHHGQPGFGGDPEGSAFEMDSPNSHDGLNPLPVDYAQPTNVPYDPSLQQQQQQRYDDPYDQPRQQQRYNGPYDQPQQQRYQQQQYYQA